MKYLILCGPSGIGKSFLTTSLIKFFPNLFSKIEQVTTREIREDEFGGNYVFLTNKRDYKKLEHLLIGKTQIGDNFYGSIPNNTNKIGIIILNELGIIDFINNIDKTKDDYFILGIDKNPDDINIKREDRDLEYIKQERNVLKYANYVIQLKQGEYVDIQEVYQTLKDNNLI